jgi:hypothetical protein
VDILSDLKYRCLQLLALQRVMCIHETLTDCYKLYGSVFEQRTNILT